MHFETLNRCVRVGLGLYHMTYVTWAVALVLRTAEHGSAVTPELYGPAVYAVPAMVWFGAQILSSAIVVMGAAIPGQLGFLTIMAGGSLQATVFGFFAKAAGDASLGAIVHTGAIYHAIPLALFTVGLAAYTRGQAHAGR